MDFVQLVRRGLWVIALLTILGTMSGVLYSWLQPTVFQTSATLLVTAMPQQSVANGQSANLLAQSRAQLLTQLATSDSVLTRAASSMGSQTTLDDLRTAVTATTVENTNFTTIAASAATAKLAAVTVEAVVRATQDVGESLDTVTTSGTASPGILITEVTPAEVPQRAFSPQPRNATLAGTAVGIALSLIVLSVREVLSQRVRGANDLRALGLGFPVVVIQRATALAGWRKGSSAVETYRYLRSNLLHTLGRRGVVAVTSISARSSDQDLGMELARAISEVGSSVIVIDARLARSGPRVQASQRPRVRAERDRSTLDSGGTTRAGVQNVGADITLVRFEDLSSETAALVERRGQQALADLAFTKELRNVAGTFDYIVVLLPPMAECAESAVAAASTDAAVLQIDASVTRRGEVLLAHQQLRASGVLEIVGAVVGAARMDILPSAPG